MDKSNNKEMEHGLSKNNCRKSIFCKEITTNLTEEDWKEHESNQTTQDEDWDQLLNIFVKLISDIHKYDKEHRKAKSNEDDFKEESKERSISERSVSLDQSNQNKVDLNPDECQLKINQDGITNNAKHLENNLNSFENSLDLQNPLSPMHMNTAKKVEDKRRFLREDNEPNWQLPFMISKHIFKNKSNRKWQLEEAIKLRRKNVCQVETTHVGDTHTNTMSKDPITHDMNVCKDVSTVNHNVGGYSSKYNIHAPTQNQILYDHGNTNFIPKVVDSSNQSAYNTRGIMNNATAHTQFNRNTNVVDRLPEVRNIFNAQEVS